MDLRAHHKPTFDNISAEKRSRILDAATNEFAVKGFENGNIGTIAKKAGVSVGSLYKYFENKQDLFLTVVQHSISQMEELLNVLAVSDEDILIQPEDLPAAEQVFRSLGYCLQSSPEDSVQIWYANPLRVELHCSLCGSMTIAGQAVQPWFDACFSRSISWNVGEGTVRTLAQQDHFLYLIFAFL